MPGVTSAYLKALREIYGRGNATEHTYRSALEDLLEGSYPNVVATNEPKRVACGAPDFAVSRHGLTVGYIEAKDLGVSLDATERTDQLKRYLRSLPNLLLTNELEFRWYVDGEERQRVTFARESNGKIASVEMGRLDDLLHSFLTHKPEPIDSPEELARRMARLTHIIHDIIVIAFQEGEASELLQDLHRSFRRVLIPDLDESTFADMFAQTLAYGLFAARVNHMEMASFDRYHASREIPKTNPFLRDLFERITGNDLDDEPFVGFVDDLAQVLEHADIAAVLQNFGKRTRREDPIVHFYETFLAAYNPTVREQRGVYYTPEPVISYIVRSVDAILKDHFNIPEGLADNSKVTYERSIDSEGNTQQAVSHRVLVLDPALGTGSFLYAVINEIRETFMCRGDAGLWSGYVRDHLLPRIFGFELMMAPYAIAHLKLGMQLAGQDLPESQREQWAYDFADDERLGVYLTNTLEEPIPVRRQVGAFDRFIAEEADAAAEVKRDLPVLVVLGNPPYSGHSANRSEIVKDGKRVKTFIGEVIGDYYQIDGKPLGERNSKWLQDDYVKFIRWGQWRIKESGSGVMALITNHGFLDNPTFRGMRQQLMETFDQVYVVDLHGSSRKGEQNPSGGVDENVFDIQTGVSISLFIRKAHDEKLSAEVRYSELWGKREDKYSWLLEQSIASTNWKLLDPQSPFYFFRTENVQLRSEWDAMFGIDRVIDFHSIGMNTHRDRFVIDLDEELLRQRIAEFLNPSRTDDEVRSRYFGTISRGKYLPGDNRDWSMSSKRAAIRKDSEWQTRFIPCLYRPFDRRYLFFHKDAIDFARLNVNQHMLRPNLSLVTTKQTKEPFAALVTNLICGQHKIAATYDGSYFFPLYLYPPPDAQTSAQPELMDLSPWPPGKDGRRPNLSPEFVKDLENRVQMTFLTDGGGDLSATFGPEDVFHYIYAIFHAPSYRERYAEFLRIDFPRVPLTSDPELFRTLCGLGADLVALHLTEGDYSGASWVIEGRSSPFSNLAVGYPVAGDNLVAKRYPKFVDSAGDEPVGDGEVVGQVQINKTQYFDQVPKEVYEFQVGGYQVCEKWLKDRRGRELTYDDLTHYRNIVVSLRETIRIMDEIDDAIPGWPLE